MTKAKDEKRGMSEREGREVKHKPIGRDIWKRTGAGLCEEWVCTKVVGNTGKREGGGEY